MPCVFATWLTTDNRSSLNGFDLFSYFIHFLIFGVFVLNLFLWSGLAVIVLERACELRPGIRMWRGIYFIKNAIFRREWLKNNCNRTCILRSIDSTVCNQMGHLIDSTSFFVSLRIRLPILFSFLCRFFSEKKWPVTIPFTYNYKTNDFFVLLAISSPQAVMYIIITAPTV